MYIHKRELYDTIEDLFELKAAAFSFSKEISCYLGFLFSSFIIIFLSFMKHIVIELNMSYNA